MVRKLVPMTDWTRHERHKKFKSFSDLTQPLLAFVFECLLY